GVTNDSWSGSGSPKTVSRRTLDLSGAGTLTNQTAVYIRLVCNSTAAISGTLGTGGTDRVDNFVVNGTAQGGTPTPTPTPTPKPTPTDPSGTGSANPASLLPGGSNLLTVNVTPGTNPTSTGLAITADLSLIGGSATQVFSGNNNTFTFTANVANGTTPGNKTLPFTITDAQSRSGTGSISLTVK